MEKLANLFTPIERPAIKNGVIGPFAGIYEDESEFRLKAKSAKEDAPHELSAAVNLIEKAELFTAKYGRTYWLAKVKRAKFAHPEDAIERLLKDMEKTRAWLASQGEKMNCGGWLTNRLAK